VTAFPPGRNSLNEYGHHLVARLAAKADIGELVVFADRTVAGPPELGGLASPDERAAAEPPRPVAGVAPDGRAAVVPPGLAPAARPDDREAGRPPAFAALVDGAVAPAAGRGRVRAEVSWAFNRLDNLPRLVRAVRRSRPDAVVFNLQFATFGDRRLAGGLGLLTPAAVRHLSGVPTVVLLHNLADNVDLRAAGFTRSRLVAGAMRRAGRVLTRALLRADLVAVTLPGYVEQLRDRYDAGNVVLIPHGSFEDAPEPYFGVPPGPRRILAFGKWGTYKVVDPLVEAYRRLLARRGHADLELVIAGPDSPNSPGYLASVAQRHADLPGLVLTGYVAEDDVADLFRSAAVVAFPYTSTTGSSGVLHQAGAYGRAAVLPRIGDLLEVIEEEGFCGEYFEPDDPGSLADAIARVLDDPVRREQLGRRNFAAAAGIAMSDVADWYVFHLQRLVAARRSA
jgi:glycosyltransferase involved in cell wall biosynthesis